MIWLQFILCAALIIWLGSLISKYADVIAVKTGLGRVWLGAILLAAITSLPELTSGISAVAWLKIPNLAVGTILGSCLFNLVLIALMDLAYQPGRVLAKAHEVHILSGGLGILLLGIIAMGVFIGPGLNNFIVLGVSLLSIFLLVLYILGGKMIAGLEKERLGEVLDKEAQAGDYAHISARRAYGIFILTAAAIVLLGIWLSYIGVQLAEETGLSSNFIGNLFLAASTSMPEIATSLAAIQLNAIDLAIGNVLGSNLFNVAMLFFFDLADGGGNFWATLNNGNGFAAVMAMMMTGVVIISLMHRSTRRPQFRISWDGLALIFMYVGAMMVLFWLG